MMPPPDICAAALQARDPVQDGRFVVAARSTGIYCRPICPVAPPLPADRLFLPGAAAAHAQDLRPCLRCRPELAPDLGPRHPDPVLARALRLIESGLLARDGVSGLAARLAVSEAELQALFTRELAASPADIADCRRFLLAKQLLTDTGLDPGAIAVATGYPDAGALEAEFARRFRRPLPAFRRASSTPDLTLLLPLKPPFDWPALMAFFAGRAIPGVEQVTPARYLRSISIGEADGWVAVTPDPSGRALRADIAFPDLASLPILIARLRRLFDLGADKLAIGAGFSGDPALAAWFAAAPGLRVPGTWDGFELAVRAVLGQQITVAGARTLAGRLVAACGDRLPTAAPLTHVFPRPARLAGHDLALTLGMPRRRGATLAGLAEKAAADPDLFLPGPALDIALARLRALPGIGEWTAQYIALRALGESDAFPAADLGLLRAMATEAGRPTPQQLLARAEAWRPWRGYAAQHLWAAPAPPARKIA